MNLDTASNVEKYLEYNYPYVVSDDAIISQLIGRPELDNLTPLERTFVSWYVVLRSPEMALMSLIRPGEFFDKTVVNSSDLIGRKNVREVIHAIFKSTPYINLYTKDFVVSILHEEIEYFRERNRERRFKDQTFLIEECNGKKSVHEEKMMESNALLKCLELLINIEKETRNDDSSTEAKPSGTSSGYSRLLTKAEDLITSGKIGGTPISSEGVTDLSGTEMATE